MRNPKRSFYVIPLSLICFLMLSCSVPLLANDDSSLGLVPEDYFDFVFLSDPQVAPDNQQILFVKTTVKDDASGRNRQIYRIAQDGGVSAFTQGTGDRSPKWSPDGSNVAFIRSVDGKSQVFMMPSDGGEAKQVTAVEEGVSAFEWFPGNNKLLLTINTKKQLDENSNDKSEDEAEEANEEEAERAEPDVVVVKNARYIANGQRYLNEKRKHLFTFDIEKEKLTQLTSGSDWNANGAVVAKDGKQIYFHGNKTGQEYEGNPNTDLFRLDIETLETVALTQHQHGQHSVSLTSDNTLMTYLHSEDVFEQTDLMLIAQDKASEPKNLTANFDRNATKALWAPDNNTLYFTTNDHGANRLFKVDAKSANVTRLLELDKSIRNLAVAKDGSYLIFTIDSAIELPELYKLTLADKALSKLTQFNDNLLASKKLSPAEPLWMTNEQGMKVQGFIHKPLDFDKNETYPLVLNIKGGPGGMWGHQWFHENQMYANKGYAVAYVNYRGSSGYGIAHSQAVRLDYGGADYRDNIQFLEEVLRQNKWIDKERLYITGGSHGGFLTNWITTKTQRFKAAVTQRSVSSWISEAGTQQFTPQQMTKEFGGDLWQNFDYYWDRSPLKYANKVMTPTLIIHSDADMITPIGQGQEWFYALKANDVPVEMVIFKGETHSLSRTGIPTNLVARLEHILDWFSRY